MFSKTTANKLAEHCLYNYKIILERPLLNSYSPLYKQNVEELEAIKNYV